MSKDMNSNRKPTRTHPPATTPEGRENQIISLAMDLAEKRIRAGTASAQEVTHYLKAGSTSARLERDILKKQKELITAKTEAIQSQKRVEELYADALKAMKKYSGDTIEDFVDYED